MNLKTFWTSLNKKTFWTSVAFTVIGILNIILFAILSSKGIVGVRRMAYMFPICFLILAWLPFVLELIFKIRFNLTFLIVFQIYVFLAMCVGSQWRIYTAGFSFDKYVHALGGLMLALLAYEIFSKSKNKGNRLSLFWVFILIFSFSMMCGAVWEIYEYTTDGWMGLNAQHAREFSGRDAVRDTMLDFVCDFAGGIAGATIAVVLEAKKKKEENSEEVENEIKKSSNKNNMEIPKETTKATKVKVEKVSNNKKSTR